VTVRDGATVNGGENRIYAATNRLKMAIYGAVVNGEKNGGKWVYTVKHLTNAGL
jgi:hypothetical protein